MKEVLYHIRYEFGPPSRLILKLSFVHYFENVYRYDNSCKYRYAPRLDTCSLISSSFPATTPTLKDRRTVVS